MTLEELKATCIERAQEELPADDEDFLVNDFAGGNMDDAYSMGEAAGWRDANRAICDCMGWDYGK